ncbi:MAG: ubiquinone biosynthesis accessory factor UbiJ [Steroidobacteraceae bacterium]
MLTALIENVLNRGLPRSPRARELCAELAGRRVCVESHGMGRFLVESDGNGLKVKRLGEAEPGAAAAWEARVRAGPLSLIALAGSDSAQALQREGIEIDGDATLAERFRELARLLRPDVEEELALAIGDIPAHELARLAKTAAGWWRDAARTTVRNVAEYLAHERRDLVSRAEGRQLLDGVAETRDRIDRIEARVGLLEQRAEARRPAGHRP